MNDWYERPKQALVDDLADGLMTGDDFNTAMRDLLTEDEDTGLGSAHPLTDAEALAEHLSMVREEVLSDQS